MSHSVFVTILQVCIFELKNSGQGHLETSEI